MRFECVVPEELFQITTAFGSEMGRERLSELFELLSILRNFKFLHQQCIAILHLIDLYVICKHQAFRRLQYNLKLYVINTKVIIYEAN